MQQQRARERALNNNISARSLAARSACSAQLALLKIIFDPWSSTAARVLRRVLYSLGLEQDYFAPEVFQRDEHRVR